MLTLSSLEPFVLSNLLIATVLGKLGKLGKNYWNAFECVCVCACARGCAYVCVFVSL